MGLFAVIGALVNGEMVLAVSLRIEERRDGLETIIESSHQAAL